MLLNQPQMSHMFVIQGVGDGLHIRSSILRAEFFKGGMLQKLVHSFAYSTGAGNAVCTLQSASPGLTRDWRWLLTSADKTESELLNLTYEFFARMLGVQRECYGIVAAP